MAEGNKGKKYNVRGEDSTVTDDEGKAFLAAMPVAGAYTPEAEAAAERAAGYGGNVQRVPDIEDRFDDADYLDDLGDDGLLDDFDNGD